MLYRWYVVSSLILWEIELICGIVKGLELLMEESLQLILERYVRLDRAFVWRTCALRMGRYNGD